MAYAPIVISEELRDRLIHVLTLDLDGLNNQEIFLSHVPHVVSGIRSHRQSIRELISQLGEAK